jgi:hypothetical protein
MKTTTESDPTLAWWQRREKIMQSETMPLAEDVPPNGLMESTWNMYR